tara:strand:- start:849 stop:1814 length:966 start_codon:yes stop_codon:yes gene_type:complete
MEYNLNRNFSFNYPNLISNLLIIIIFLGTSVYINTRYFFFLILFIVFIVSISKIRLNKPVFSTYFLIVINIYFLFDSIIFNDPSSSYLFKTFIYVLIFDLFLKSNLINSKSFFYIFLLFSALTLILNLLYSKGIFGTYSDAFNFPRVISVSMVSLPLLLLFNYVNIYHHIFIFFSTFITFSGAAYLLYFIVFFRNFPVFIFIILSVIFINFNFEDYELINQFIEQKQISFEKKIGNVTSNLDGFNQYEISETLSVELYHNGGFLFSTLVTLFLIYYLYKNSGSILFSFFSLILISSNPFPLILLLIIGNFLKISKNKYENR